MNQWIMAVILSVFVTSCSSIQSGKYIKLRNDDTVDSLSKEFNVPHAAILNANRDRSFIPGQYVFIPQDRGFMAHLLNAPAYGKGIFSKEDFFKDPFLWPLPDYHTISTGFGVMRWGKVHQGLDIPAPSGTAVLAADDGEVISTEYDGNGYGKLILVKHKSGLETLYGHLKKRLIANGQKVFRGQIIGLVGSTGKSTGYHLHFEVRKQGDALDPYRYVSKN